PYLPRVSWPLASTSSMRAAIQARSSGRNWIRAAGTVRRGASTGVSIGRDGMREVLLLVSLRGLAPGLGLAIDADQGHPGDDQGDAGPPQRRHRLLEEEDTERRGDGVLESRQREGDADLRPRQDGQEQEVEQGVAHRAGDHPGVGERMPEVAGK